MLSVKQNDSQPEENNVIHEFKAENRPVPEREAKMKLSEPEPDKLTAESVEKSYATHDGKNKCLIADL